MTLKIFTIISFLFSFSSFLHAKELFIPSVPAKQSELRHVDFYLMTVDSGRNIADIYGHFGIRVDDRVSGIDSVYHWGKYKFDSPLFLWNFYRGELTYEMTIWPYDTFVSVYEKAQRSLIQDKLNLTLEQKNALYQKLRWNSFPENRKFSYQYWTQNCATVPRDYLNEVLLGHLESSFASIKTSKTYRDYIHEYLGQFSGIDLLTDVLVGPRVERSLNAWESMFLPSNVHKNISLINRVDDNGQSVAGAPLVSESKKILNFSREDRSSYDYLFMTIFLFGSLGLGICLAYGSAANSVAAKRLKVKKIGIRIIGLVTILYGILSFILGMAIASNHFFSGHPDTYANVNILLLSPLDFIYIFIGFNLIVSGTKVKDRLLISRGISLFFAIRTLTIALMGVGIVLGIVNQDVSRSMMLFGSFNAALNFALWAMCLLRQPLGLKSTQNKVNALKQQPVNAE